MKNRRLDVEVISLEGCRALLGREAAGVSAEEIGAVRDHADAMARVLIESLLEQQSRSSEKDDDISTVR